MQHGSRLRLGILKLFAPTWARLRGCVDGLLPHLLPLAFATRGNRDKESHKECGPYEICA